MEPGRARILVVGGHEPWRRFICSTLAAQAQFQMIGSVADGLEAVQKAQELRPDLIVLDIGLPGLNGIEAGRRIREFSPQTKVLLISENRLAEVAESAFRMGALGYIVKSRAAAELLPAVDAILQGKRFVGALLTGASLPRSKNDRASCRPRSSAAADAPFPAPGRGDRRRHEVEFYPDHSAFVAGFARFVEAGMKNGSAVIVIANESHRAGLFQRLKVGGMDPDSMNERGRFFTMDAETTLSTFMVNGKPDPVRCAQMVVDVIAGAAKHANGGHQRVAICGECAPSLLAAGKVEDAIRVEHLWDVLTEGYDADTLCGYVWSAIPPQDRNRVVARICAEHSAVRGRELGGD